jgi:beta-lactamase class A
LTFAPAPRRIDLAPKQKDSKGHVSTSHLRRPTGRLARYPAMPPSPSALPANGVRRLRLPSLTGLVVRALCVTFVVTAIWRLGVLALSTYEAERFSRPPVATRLSEQRDSPVTETGLESILARAALPGGVVGAYVRNISTGAGAGVNVDRRFRAASLYKVPVMVEVYKQQRLKKFGWDDELVVGHEHWTDGSGVLQARVGDSIKIGELLRLMIVESDNIAANMLTDLVGAANVNETMESLGLRSTRVVDRLKENASPTTNAADMGRLLEIIATGQLVDAQTSEEAIRLLEQKQAQSWLAEGLPLWGRLAHKWGDIPNGRHDAGIIYTPRSQVVLVVLTENGSPAEAAAQIKTISREIVSYIDGPGP